MSITLILMLLVTGLGSQQTESGEPVAQSKSAVSECSQSIAERDSLISEAEQNQYTLLWVVFIGNAHTRDNVLRRRMINLTEGDIFLRNNLIKSLQNVSKLKKVIYPVSLTDVKISLDQKERVVNLDICFKEKKH